MLADSLKAIPSAKIKPVMLADGLKAIPSTKINLSCLRMA